MSEMYTIKPLEWGFSEHSDDEPPSYRVDVDDQNGYYDVWYSTIEGSWMWWGGGTVDTDKNFAESDDAAKLAAEAHWQERIKQALVPVEVKQHDGSGQ